MAQIVSLSDTVKPGTYTVNVTADATKAKVEGSVGADIDTDTFTNGVVQPSQAGTINLNGEEVRIDAGDTAEVVFDKLRDLAETVGLNLIAYDDNSGSPDYNSGAQPFEFGSKMHLVFEAKEYGSEYYIDINASNSTLLSDLGLTILRLMALMYKHLLIENSDFNATATVTTKGNVITINDIDGFTMKRKHRTIQ